jgi:bacteriocin-like protein
MSDLRELTADELNAVTGGCRTVDTRIVDSNRAPIVPAFADTSTTNPGHPATTNLKLCTPLL